MSDTADRQYVFARDEELDVRLDERGAERYGDLEIGGVQFRYCDVLWELDNEAYGAALNEYRDEKREELERAVTEQFPAPVAHCFYRFLHGAENEIQRLHLLRDTWEAMIRLLCGLVVGECRAQSVCLEASAAKFKMLLSDRVNDKVLAIESILSHSRNQGISLAVARLIPLSVVKRIRKLNQTRNAFSHVAASSEVQAKRYVAEAIEDVMSTLADLRGLEEVSLARFLDQSEPCEIRHDRFDGHATTKTIKRIRLPEDRVAEARRYLDRDRIIAILDATIIGVGPFIHYEDDETGHVTRLCLLKRSIGESPNRVLDMEVVGESRQVRVNRSAFAAELNEVRGLFGLGPDEEGG